MPKKQTILSQPRFYQLCRWLAELPQHELDGHTVTEVTTAASKVLGFEIAPATTKKAANAAGVIWQIPRQRASTDARNNLARVQKQLDGLDEALVVMGERLDRYNENHRELILRVSGVEQSLLSLATNTSELRGEVVRLGKCDVNHAKGIEDVQHQLLERCMVSDQHREQLADIRKRLETFGALNDCHQTELDEQRERLAEFAKLLQGTAESIAESPPPNVQRFTP